MRGLTIPHIGSPLLTLYPRSVRMVKYTMQKLVYPIRVGSQLMTSQLMTSRNVVHAMENVVANVAMFVAGGNDIKKVSMCAHDTTPPTDTKGHAIYYSSP